MNKLIPLVAVLAVATAAVTGCDRTKTGTSSTMPATPPATSSSSTSTMSTLPSSSTGGDDTTKAK